MTSTEIVTLPPTDRASVLIASLSVMSTEQLRAELVRALSDTAERLLRLAVIIRTLEDRGEDLSDLRLGLIDYLRLVAYGQLLPEVVVRFGERPILLQKISTLPLPDQQRLAAGEPVALAVLRDGQSDIRLADPLRLTREQVSQVFGSGRIRDQAEQLLVLEERLTKPKKPALRQHGRVMADPERGELRIGRTRLRPPEVVAALADLASAESDGELVKAVGVRLTDDEHAKLQAIAQQHGVAMSDLARQALRAYGLI